MRSVLLFLICSFIALTNYSQQVFESGIIYGGVTGGGFSTNTGSGTVTSNVAIPINSTIKKAYLLAARDGVAPNITVFLNGNNYEFSDSTVVSSPFISGVQTGWTWNNSTIHAIDITNNIDSSATSYNLTIPPQFNVTVNGFYSSFYLYVIYENVNFNKMAYHLVINEQDVSINETYNLTNLSPINNTNPVGIGIFGIFFCDTIQDGSYITVNNDTLGLVGGTESNTLNTCTGIYANFSYYNDSLFGLEDDTPDSLMAATDALADIKSNISNGATSVMVNSILQTPGINGGELSNPIAAVMLSYTTPCDTFTTTATPNDTICLEESIQLQATGGVQYSWFSAFGGLSDTSIANPIATPTQTTTYIVTIKNDSGCVKTEQVKIWVNSPVPIDSVLTQNSACSTPTGSIHFFFSSTPNYVFNLYDNNNTLIANNTTGIFNPLPAGTYLVESIYTANSCSWVDSNTVTINQYIDVTANFTRNPFKGKAPLTVNFGNISTNENSYIWMLPNDTFYTENLTFTFDSGGVYPICLVAYNNNIACGDTFCYNFIVDDNWLLTLPNVFTPNGDGVNDFFSIIQQDIPDNGKITVSVYNRWGEELHHFVYQNSTLKNNPLNIWNGTTSSGNNAPDGTYFYVVNYGLINEKPKTIKGSVTLLR